MKRFLLALALAALAVSPARAQMVKEIGDFVYGDNLSDLTVIVYDGGSRYDLTGATVTLLAWTTVGGRRVAVSTPVFLVSPSTGVCRVEDLGLIGADPGRRRRDVYVARLQITKGGETGYPNETFRFGITTVEP